MNNKKGTGTLTLMYIVVLENSYIIEKKQLLPKLETFTINSYKFETVVWFNLNLNLNR